MTYANPVFHYGYDEFFSKCEKLGVDGIIVPDMPFEPDYLSLESEGYFAYINSFVLGDADTGVLLCALNHGDKVSIASISKLMTYLLFKEDPSFDEAMRPYEKKKLRAADIVGDESKFDEDNPLFGRVCVFTGALESFTRREAMQLVADLGGECGDNITQKTNFLVLGNNDYCASIKGGKSNKQKKAESLIAKGADLQIISESAFLDMLR